MKKFLVVVAVLLCLFTAEVYAQVNINVDGVYVDFYTAQPFVDSGVTFVPVKPVFEKLGYSVEWDEETKTVSMQDKRNKVSVGVGADFFYINGQQKDAYVPARIQDGSVVAPVKLLAESLDVDVQWDGETKTVFLRQGDGRVMDTDEFLQSVEYYVSAHVIMDNLDGKIEGISLAVDDAIQRQDNEDILYNLTCIANARKAACAYIAGLTPNYFCAEYGRAVKDSISCDIDYVERVINGYKQETPVTEAELNEYMAKAESCQAQTKALDESLSDNIDRYIRLHAYTGELSREEQQEIGGFIDKVVNINLKNYAGIVDDTLLDDKKYGDYASLMYTYINEVRNDYSQLVVPEKDRQAGAIINYSLNCLKKYADAFQKCSQGAIDEEELYNRAIVNACVYIQLQSFVVGDSSTIFDSEIFTADGMLMGEKI